MQAVQMSATQIAEVARIVEVVTPATTPLIRFEVETTNLQAGTTVVLRTEAATKDAHAEREWLISVSGGSTELTR